MNKIYAIIMIITGTQSPMGWAEQSLDALALKVSEAQVQSRPAPVLSLEQNLTVGDAYLIQTLAVKNLLGNVMPVGFKAGLTSIAAQEKFAVQQPVSGVLLSAGGSEYRNGRFLVANKDYQNMMLEAEIGFVAGDIISQKVTHVDKLKSRFSSVLPVIELPDLSFEYPARIQGVDIIANNVVAKYYLAGKQQDWVGQDLNSLTIQVSKDGERLLQGQGSDAMGNQWQALLWLVNQTIDNGWTIRPGQLLITGAMGQMISAQTGLYDVDFGLLGQITLEVE